MFGIESFVSDHSGFSGGIKHDCKDFVVHEIDLHGNVVQIDATYDICIARNNDSVREGLFKGTTNEDHSKDGVSKPISDCKPRGELLNDKDSLKHNPLSISNLTQSAKQSEEIQPDVKEPHEVRTVGKCKSTYLLRLKEILGDEQVEKITAFAESQFELNFSKKATDMEQTLNSAQAATFSVGTESSKQTRTEIHSAIKYLFPHLCTDTLRQSKETISRIINIGTSATYWKLHRVVAADEIDDFIRFLNEKDITRTFSLTSSKDKKERTQMHREISRYYGSLVEAKTFVTSDGPNKETVHKIVVRFRQKQCRRGQKRKATEQESIFSGFVLKKENLEMLDVINKLAGILRVHPSDFSYAGIKDKKAVTTQLMCVKGITSQRLKTHFCQTDIGGLQIGNVHSLPGPIQRGQLSGNQFEIIIRDVKLKQNVDSNVDGAQMIAMVEEEIGRSVENIQMNMFINYFGHQRFGLAADVQGNAANIGLELLKGNHVQAVKHLLSPVEGKDDAVNKAKRFFQETQDAKNTLSMMPNYKSRECMLLKALHRHGLDQDACTKALMSIPHSMRQLYVHSYCSLVWNKMATQRLNLYGRQLMEGDLVIPAGTDKIFTRDQVHIVTQEDIESNSFTMQDVILPLPGNSIQYPSNKVGYLYQDCLKLDGLSQSSFRLNSLKINIPGDYRKLLQCPTNLTYNVYQSTSVGRTPILEDNPKTTDVSTTDVTNDTSQNNINLKLCFRLPASSYATMCVREMMKE